MMSKIKRIIEEMKGQKKPTPIKKTGSGKPDPVF